LSSRVIPDCERIAEHADEQAALRRIATLVAHGAPAPQIYDAVAEEVGPLLGAEITAIQSYEPDGYTTLLGSWGKLRDVFPVGRRWKLEGDNVTTLVYRTERPVRLDHYERATGSVPPEVRKGGVHSVVASPIVVTGRVWGVVVAGTSRADPLPTDAESRIAEFTELVATAISNIQARGEVQRLAEEQAALRRVATIVARECPAAEVFAQVAEEVGLLLQADAAGVWRYEPDGYGTIVGSWGNVQDVLPVGSRSKLDGDSAVPMVHRTGRPVRNDRYQEVTGTLAASSRRLGLRSAVGTPIIVNGRLWGAIAAATGQAEPLPADAESRIGEFTELVAASISNAQARSDLAASRARIVAAADDERRRLVRDLHDGAQQRLVHTIITLKRALRARDSEDPERAWALVGEARQHAEQANAELRELAHGILPSTLTDGGLRAGVDGLASRMLIPVELDIAVDRLSAPVEATAYFVVAEALTNVAKHSQAHRATVKARLENRRLQVEVRDDGVGGARADGTGLIGLTDRLAALEGSLRVESPNHGGTLIAASIPVR
jgi:signal transduction histidine kinase